MHNSMTDSKVLVAGGVNIDTTYWVKKLPLEGETVFATGTTSSLGGKGLNQAVAVSRAGASVALLGAVGNDHGADEVRGFLRDEDINTVLLATAADSNTGNAIIVVDTKADNTIIVNPGANSAATFNKLPHEQEQLRGVKMVVANGEVPATCVHNLFAYCRNIGIATVWNPSPVPDKTSTILAATNILVVNMTEASEIARGIESAEKLAEKLSAAGPREIVITQGSQGAATYFEGVFDHLPAVTVEATDPTAAGDTFLGYYVASRARRYTPLEAAKAALYAAAQAVQVEGAVPSIPRLDISDLIKNA